MTSPRPIPSGYAETVHEAELERAHNAQFDEIPLKLARSEIAALLGMLADKPQHAALARKLAALL